MTDDLPASAAPLVEAAAKPFPRIWPSIGWIVLYFVLQFATTVVMLAVVLGVGKLTDRSAIGENSVLLMWSLIVTVLIHLALMWIYLRKCDRLMRLGLTHFGIMPVWRAIGLTFVLVAAAMTFNYLYATYVIPGIPMQDDIAKVLQSIERTPLNVAVIFFAIAIAAPLVEEILFRGLLQNALAQPFHPLSWLPKNLDFLNGLRAITLHLPIWAAIILSSFSFAVVHGQPYAIPGLMSLSLVFGYIYHRTGSLRTNIILHMANNAIALILLAQGMGQ